MGSPRAPLEAELEDLDEQQTAALVDSWEREAEEEREREAEREKQGTREEEPTEGQKEGAQNQEQQAQNM